MTSRNVEEKEEEERNTTPLPPQPTWGVYWK